MTETRMEITRPIPASAADIFAVLCDPYGHVDIDSTGMLIDATGEPAKASGDIFVIHMDREALGDYDLGKYDVNVVIGTYEQDKEISWSIASDLMPPIGHYYGYRLAPGEDGETLVTSYYDWSEITEDWVKLDVFPIISEVALKATLGILERTVRRRASGRK